MPRRSSSRSTRFTVAREVPASPATSSCVSGITERGAAVPVERGEVADAAQHPRLGREEQRLDEALVHTPHAVGEDGDQHVVHARMLVAEPLQVVGVHGVRLRRLQGDDGRRAARVAGHERDLAERLARLKHGERRRVAELGRDPDGEAALRDQVQRVARIATMEDHLVTVERAAARGGHQAAELFPRKSGEEAEIHAVDPTPGAGKRVSSR